MAKGGFEGQDPSGSGEVSDPQGMYPLERKSPEEVDAILARLRSGLEELYGDRLVGVYLFGSYARGEQGVGSDLDVLVVLDRVKSSWREIQRTSQLTADLSLEYDVTVCGIFASEEEWRDAATPFLRNVRREGVPA